MNKIDPLSDAKQPFTGSNIKNTTQLPSVDFENALNKAIHNGEPAKSKSAQEMSAASTGGLTEIAPTHFHLNNPSQSVSGKTDQLIEMLGAYSEQLTNPEISLKSIAPVLEEINQNAGQLIKETQDLPASEKQLKEIAQHTAVTAQTEYLKFQRGDYL